MMDSLNGAEGILEGLRHNWIVKGLICQYEVKVSQ